MNADRQTYNILFYQWILVALIDFLQSYLHSLSNVILLWSGLYYIEYTLQNPGESLRHLFSVLGIANNGWYNRLYTLTGQVCIGNLFCYLIMVSLISFFNVHGFTKSKSEPNTS